jgi:hypothetical protein
MSGTPCIDGPTLDEAREAHRQGVPLATLAGKLRCDTDHLTRLLGLPQWRQVPADVPDGCVDLWRADRLDAVL